MASASANITSLAASASASASEHAAELKNPAFKIVGVCLAIGSGFFIGASFVVKKKGLLRATKKYNNVAGEGHAYLKSWLWWTGMVMMIIGEVLNFVAYAFTEAILVTPMGALSVVICAILSHFLLKEGLTFFGWIGCTLCILGATILALNAPEEQSVTTIEAFKKLFLAPGFLVWASILLAVSAFLAIWAAPRYGRKTMFVYISICSLVGGISVACTQGFGASTLSTIQGKDDAHKNWFYWVLLAFVMVTLLVEINYLNKALELFNASMVVPSYFCYFTSCVMISSFILYQGLKSSAVTLITMVMGFLVTCLGITLLQMSKVDPVELSKLDRKSTILLAASKQNVESSEKGEVTALEEPGMDALRGGFGAVGSIIRARSMSRRASTMSRSMSRNFGDGLYDSNQNLSTGGLQALTRYQLSDSPLPVDALDKISQHAGKSPTMVSGPSHDYFEGPVTRPRAKSHLKFEEDDVVHQYGYGKEVAMHNIRHHPAPPLLPRGSSARVHQNSYPPVKEEDADYDLDSKQAYNDDDDYSRKEHREYRRRNDGTVSPGSPVDPPQNPHQTPRAYNQPKTTLYDDPYASPTDSNSGSSRTAYGRAASSPTVPTLTLTTSPSNSPRQSRYPCSGSGPSSNTGGGGGGGGPGSPSATSSLSGFFNFGSVPNLTLGRKSSGGILSLSHKDKDKDREVRGGAHRGMDDYPHRPKGDEEAEHEERRGLVRESMDGDGDDRDDRDGRTDMAARARAISEAGMTSEGRAVQGVRRLPGIPGQAQPPSRG